MEYKDSSDAFNAARGVLDYLEGLVDKTFLSRVFIQKYRVKWWAPPLWFGFSYEIDDLYRKAPIAWVSLPGTRRALVFGIWGTKSYKEDEGLLRALRLGKEPDEDDLSHFDVDNARDVQFSNSVDSRVRKGRYRLRDGATRNDGAA